MFRRTRIEQDDDLRGDMRNLTTISLRALDAKTIDSLKDLLGDRFDFLLSTYVSDCTARAKSISETVSQLCLSDGQYDESMFRFLASQVHAIKGSSRNIGANALADVCELMEKGARSHNFRILEQNIAAFDKNFAAVTSDIRQLRSVASA